jgi:hypothetical protein
MHKVRRDADVQNAKSAIRHHVDGDGVELRQFPCSPNPDSRDALSLPENDHHHSSSSARPPFKVDRRLFLSAT